ncbi:four helix bundle protein [Maribacter algicola]|uniref:Four helix bundle protein n=1 Tax=Meishania litoralis TaxID=3434685 RepID=A0ACC7LLK8_9FLAO
MKNIKFAFEDLNVYEKALDSVDLAYETTTNFPKHELYGLVSLLNKAAVSIALNIAEGSGHTSPQLNRFLQIAINSVKECVVCSTVASRRKYISAIEDNEIRQKLEELSKMMGLQKYLKK